MQSQSHNPYGAVPATVEVDQLVVGNEAVGFVSL